MAKSSTEFVLLSYTYILQGHSVHFKHMHCSKCAKISDHFVYAKREVCVL